MAFRGEDPKIKSSLTVTKSNSAGDVPLVVSNTSNTASSTATITTSVAGASADNPFYVATVTGAQSWSWGIDNSDSDSFKIAHAANLDSNIAVTIDTSKNISGAASITAATGFTATTGNIVATTGEVRADTVTSAGATNPVDFSTNFTLSNAVHTVTDDDYTITDTDGYSLILMSGGSSDRTVTLPTLADNQGRTITVKRIDAPSSGQASIIIDGEGSETIDGATTTKIGRRYGGQYTGKYASITLFAGPSEWHIIETTNDVIYQESTTSWSTSIQNANSVAVPAGTWEITVFSYKSAGSAGSNISVGVSTTSATYSTDTGFRSYTLPNSGTGTTSISVVVKPTSETTYYHVFNTDSITGGSTGEHSMTIKRI